MEQVAAAETMTARYAAEREAAGARREYMAKWEAERRAAHSGTQAVKAAREARELTYELSVRARAEALAETARRDAERDVVTGVEAFETGLKRLGIATGGGGAAPLAEEAGAGGGRPEAAEPEAVLAAMQAAIADKLRPAETLKCAASRRPCD